MERSESEAYADQEYPPLFFAEANRSAWVSRKHWANFTIYSASPNKRTCFSPTTKTGVSTYQIVINTLLGHFHMAVLLDRIGAGWQDEELRKARPCLLYAPDREKATNTACAEVAELADALHSGCSSRQGVEVRVLSSAPYYLISTAYPINAEFKIRRSHSYQPFCTSASRQHSTGRTCAQEFKKITSKIPRSTNGPPRILADSNY